MNAAIMHRGSLDEADTAAALWVERRRVGLSATEQREFAKWLDAESRNRDAFARMAAMAGVLQRARAGSAANEIGAQLRARGARRRRRSRVTAAAASVMILLTVSAVWWGRSPAHLNQEVNLVATASFEPIRRLPDGSIVELNAGAEIVVKYERSFRHIDLLRGEAMFQVEKDATRPFVVRVAGVDVRAVGTAFNVRLAPSSIEVLVTEGTVQVADATQGKSLLPPAATEETSVLFAGSRVLISVPSNGIAPVAAEVATVTPAEVKALLAWRMPRMEFDGVELADAVSRLNRQNRVQILIEDDAVGKLRVSGSFASEDPQTFSRLVAVTFGLEAEQRTSMEIVLRRK
jgi:transmembrane sensor